MAALASVALPSTACGDLLFRNDHRVTIVTPQKYATVNAPLTVTWTTKDFTVPVDGSFAIFLDRDPQGPGQTLQSFGGDRYHIYTATTTSLRLDQVEPHSGADASTRNHHDLTVVLLDRDGRRIGETAGYVEFQVNAS